MPNVFAHLEFEYNTLRYTDYGYDFINNSISTIKVTGDAPALLAGAGYRQPVTPRSSLIITLLYDVLNGQNKYSPYGNNVFVRTGFVVGF